MKNVATPEAIDAARRANLKARSLARLTEVVISVPFAHLVPDNQKYAATSRGGKARLFLTAEYREAKEYIRLLARRAMQGQQMSDEDVTLYAQLYMPDARRRDATNYAKLFQDSLQSAVYADDTQIKKATWENMGIDRESPRCDITVTRRAA